MENASKALLIAGGVLLTMMIVGFIIFALGKFSDFYNRNDDLLETENLSDFNMQFTNYENREVYGYELISLANKVADYNFRYSNAVDAKNDAKYTPISLSIDLNGKKEKLVRIESNTFFTKNNYSINEFSICLKNAQQIENEYGSSDSATKMAKSIDSIILSSEQLAYNQQYKNMNEEQSKAEALDTFNRISEKRKFEEYKSDNKKITACYNQMKSFLQGTGNIEGYYEYYMFKRAIFKCNPIKDSDYDSVSGRIKAISFVFQGSLK